MGIEVVVVILGFLHIGTDILKTFFLFLMGGKQKACVPFFVYNFLHKNETDKNQATCTQTHTHTRTLPHSKVFVLYLIFRWWFQ